MTDDRATAHVHGAPRRHPEFVVLEIGEELGALIVHADAEMCGIEIEISPSGGNARRSHKAVLERLMGGRPAYTAVFDQLREGTYTLWTAGVPYARDVAVAGGKIAEVSLTSEPPKG